MGAYLQGYFMGKSDACETAAELFGPRKPIHDLDQDPERRCFRHAKRYTMSVADYVSIITSFYEKYPEHRDIPVDYFMIVFRDQRYKTLADIERGMRKGAFRTTF